MAGSLTGGRKAAQTIKAREPDFYKRIGAMSHEAWVRNGRKPRGFAFDRENARIAGAKGGRISKRKSRKEVIDDEV